MHEVVAVTHSGTSGVPKAQGVFPCLWRVDGENGVSPAKGGASHGLEHFSVRSAHDELRVVGILGLELHSSDLHTETLSFCQIDDEGVLVLALGAAVDRGVEGQKLRLRRGVGIEHLRRGGSGGYGCCRSGGRSGRCGHGRLRRGGRGSRRCRRSRGSGGRRRCGGHGGGSRNGRLWCGCGFFGCELRFGCCLGVRRGLGFSEFGHFGCLRRLQGGDAGRAVHHLGVGFLHHREGRDKKDAHVRNPGVGNDAAGVLPDLGVRRNPDFDRELCGLRLHRRDFKPRGIKKDRACVGEAAAAKHHLLLCPPLRNCRVAGAHPGCTREGRVVGNG